MTLFTHYIRSILHLRQSAHRIQVARILINYKNTRESTDSPKTAFTQRRAIRSTTAQLRVRLTFFAIFVFLPRLDASD